MKIAIVAPFEESVPPKKYGGTEVVVYNLVSELVRLGHEVTIFATGDSQAPCKIEPIFPTALRITEPYASDPKTREAAKYLGISKVLSKLNEGDFDVIHNHLGWRLLFFYQHLHKPLVTTLHGPMDISYQKMAFTLSPNFNFVSISDNQRKPLPDLNYVATVYNGIDLEQFPFQEKPEGDYLLFLARFSPEKGAREAIEIAKKTGKKLLLAVKVDAGDQKYFEEVKPLIDGRQIQLLGEVDSVTKAKLLGNATALLAPIQWEEPFGLYAIEAMACGTPVIGIGRGAFPEIIENGVDGFLAKDAEEMVKMVPRINQINRQACRRSIEKRFTKQMMASNYLEVYKKICG